MSYSAILSALEAVVATYATANSLSVVWEATERQPLHGEAGLVCSFMPSRSRGATIGQDGYDEKPGLFQVTVYGHRGRGLGAILTHVDGLVDAFKRKSLTVGSSTVHSFRAYPASPFESGDYTVVPVTVEWSAFE